jgi:squalene synthase HpnC
MDIIRSMYNGFGHDLKRFGPDRIGTPMQLTAARSYCSRLARTHYENFSVASLLLPRRLWRHFHAVYAYCRWADDLADEVGGGPQALALLRWWQEELLHCYDGRPRHPVMVALRETIWQFRIPPEPFLNLLFAFEQDQIVKRYRTFEQLLGYCQNSANPVGHLILYLGDAYNRENAALSDHICTALQLTNFWQDVARDLDIGRVYLPEEDRQRFGYTEADLHNRRYSAGFVELMRFEVERTRDLFYRGLPLLERMPPRLQADVELFVRGGLAVLRKIERCRYNVWAARPALAKWEKAALVGATLARRWNALLSPTRQQRSLAGASGSATTDYGL